MPVIRPSSWQAELDQAQASNQQMDSRHIDAALAPAIEGLESLAVANTPSNIVRQSIQDAFSMAYGYHVNAPILASQQPQSYWTDNQHMVPTTQVIDEQPSAHFAPHNAQFGQVQGNGVLFPAAAPLHAYADSSNDSPGVGLFDGISDYYIGANEMSYPGVTFPEAPPNLRRKKSKELVGIGLYNDKEPNFLSSLNADTNRESLGKELKLEESWVPPNSREPAEEDDDCSSDEAEEVEDHLDSPDTAQFAPQPTFYPTAGDLSNHSFFFSDDEHYASDDQHANYLNMAQAYHNGQAKMPAMANKSTGFAFF